MLQCSTYLREGAKGNKLTFYSYTGAFSTEVEDTTRCLNDWTMPGYMTLVEYVVGTCCHQHSQIYKFALTYFGWFVQRRCIGLCNGVVFSHRCI